LTPPTLAQQVYCPVWDSRSGLIVRVLWLMVKSPLVVMTFEVPGPIHSTVGAPTIPLERVTLHVRLYCWPSAGIFPLVTNTSSVSILVGEIKGAVECLIKGGSFTPSLARFFLLSFAPTKIWDLFH